jgi:hypothetical protein
VSVRFGRERGDSLQLSFLLPHDSSIFLGGREKTTLEEWSKMLGRETIETFHLTDTKGQAPSYTKNFQKLGKDGRP